MLEEPSQVEPKFCCRSEETGQAKSFITRNGRLPFRISVARLVGT
jgi:hypothetical protein